MEVLEESVDIEEETVEDLSEKSTEENQKSDITTPEESAPGDSSEDVSEGDASASAPEDDISTGDTVDVSGSDVSEGDVSGGDNSPVSSVSQLILSENPDVEELLFSIWETEQHQLESLVKIEAQNEAVISILLIIIVVGLLHYVYKFFKLFF